MVVNLNTKFKPLIFSVLGCALSSIANIFYYHDFVLLLYRTIIVPVVL
jgi:hypothetical protein